MMPADLRARMEPLAEWFETHRGADDGTTPALYDDLAPVYDFVVRRRFDHDAMAEFVARETPDEATRVLVGGCGPGRLLVRLAAPTRSRSGSTPARACSYSPAVGPARPSYGRYPRGQVTGNRGFPVSSKSSICATPRHSPRSACKSSQHPGFKIT